MKKILIYLGLVVAATTIVSCKESLPENFGQVEGIYFNNVQENGTLVASKSLTFIYVDDDVIQIPVRIQLLGRIATQARPINIRVASQNAVEGVDYLLTTEAILPANTSTLDYMVTLKRTEALKTQEKTLSLEIASNDHFIIPFTSQKQSDGTVTSVVTYTINFSDQFTAPPAGWQNGFAGVFSVQKFELICRVMEIPRADFNVLGGISSAKWMYIQTAMINYVKDQVEHKNAGEPYDKEAFDANGTPLSFTSNS